MSELIWEVYRDTGYFDYAGGMPGGKRRQANLRVLYDRARSYEATAFRGLFRFCGSLNGCRSAAMIWGRPGRSASRRMSFG
ncbi:hypothetical protein QNN00_23775 [Bacillus velezensis]|nr:hypothetical protein [Bacillus velezensis]